MKELTDYQRSCLHNALDYVKRVCYDEYFHAEECNDGTIGIVKHHGKFTNSDWWYFRGVFDMISKIQGSEWLASSDCNQCTEEAILHFALKS